MFFNTHEKSSFLAVKIIVRKLDFSKLKKGDNVMKIGCRCFGTGKSIGVEFIGPLVGLGPDCPFCKGKGHFDSLDEWWDAQLTNWRWNLVSAGIIIGLIILIVYLSNKQ
jgi:hypothetical protein